MLIKFRILYGLLLILFNALSAGMSQAQSLPTAPSPPCTIVAYAPCNYLIPANDYASFAFTTPITILTTSSVTPTPTGQCQKGSLNTVTVSFQATPPAGVALLVWLTGSLGTTQPVYMTSATQTFSTSFFSDPTTPVNPYTWFAVGTWTNLCIQAIYPNPPPTSFYYPQSCTIVYQ